MKTQIFIAFVALFAFGAGVFVPPRVGHKKPFESKECTYGQIHWCQNLTTAADCRAVRHCIQNVWLYKQLPPDTSNVCQTCLEMVKEARDQLLSNDTQELIKEVFEGTCALLHFKPIVQECDKISDQYIPDLIDTLASEMNPQIVCSVAGLCNNEKYLKLLAEEGKTQGVDKCDGCHTVIAIMESKFRKMSRDEVLQGFLEVCGKTGSLSDGCSNIIITYFTEIYNHLKDNLNPNEVCLMAGECSGKFHTHANVEITPISHIGYVPVKGNDKDDLPCELCEQLVSHLRDLLIANTTEDEFKLVLEGLCYQTKSFKQECLSLVDQYYAKVYNFLVEQLDSTEVCSLTGLCPRNTTQQISPIIPLLPVQTIEKTLEITPAPKLARINMAKSGSNVRILETAEEAQLPIDRLVPPHAEMYNSETCVFCEYFLHYIQQYITETKTEEEIKKIIDNACSRLPASINDSCVQFVDMYEPAIVAILAQEIDPSQVCPLIRACPSNTQNVEVFMQQGSNEKCPLCLFAVQKLEEMVKDKKTQENIKNALSKLCLHLPKNIAQECNDFVKTYTDELVEMLVADLNPQEVCVYLKLCTEQETAISPIIGDTKTNNINDDTINGRSQQPVKSGPQCVICEFVMKEIQDNLKDNSTEHDIISIVHHVCNVMPRSVNNECNAFVNEYADSVIQLLIEMTVPSEICRYIKLCTSQQKFKQVKTEIFDCAICETLVHLIEKVLTNPKVSHDVDHVLKKACRAMPARNERKKCQEIVGKYGTQIFELVTHLADKGLVCKEVMLCANAPFRPQVEHMVGVEKCTYGPSYWCASDENAAKCGTLQHCQEKVWKVSAKPKI